LVVRLSTVATVVASLLVGHIERFREGFPDEVIYRLLARNLREHHFYGYAPNDAVAYRPPGYPFFEAAVRTLHDSQVMVRVAQAILAGCIVYLAASIARRLHDEIAGAVTALVLLGVGTLAVYASFELSETVATVALVTAVAAAIAAADAKSWIWAAVAGAALAASAYARPQAMLLVVVLATWLVIASQVTLRRRIAIGAALVAAFIAVLAPWTIRNAVRIHSFTPIATYGGEAFFLGNNEKADGRFRRTNDVAPEDFTRIRALPEGQQEREWYRLGFRFIREHPSKAIANWIRNARLFLTLDDSLIADHYALRGSWRPPRLDDRWLWFPAAVGVMLSLVARDRLRRSLPGVLMLYFVVVFMLFIPFARFRHGLVPFLAISCGAAAAVVRQWVVERRGTRTQEAETEP
jgi:4-amino-4-deoxy-L-arabinose transferase-like glycosyltransferase